MTEVDGVERAALEKEEDKLIETVPKGGRKPGKSSMSTNDTISLPADSLKGSMIDKKKSCLRCFCDIFKKSKPKSELSQPLKKAESYTQ